MQTDTASLPRETADIETASDAYAARFAGPAGAWLLEVQTAAVLKLLAPGQGLSLLEVGGGHGQLARPLVEAGHAYTVLGSDPVCAKRISDLVAAGRCRFVTGNVSALPFPDRSFDAVLCIRLLTHCAQWQTLAAELCRTARRSVIVEYPLHEGLHRLAPLFFGMKKKVEGNTRTWTAFRHREVTAAFEALGFREEAVVRQFFWPLVLHRMLGRRGLSERLEAMAHRAGWTARAGSPAISKMVRTGD
jgi:2-polyprenyl-3-methyl-5-hydroxy-6-metoxy-1,4-benzoquinol methylase